MQCGDTGTLNAQGTQKCSQQPKRRTLQHVRVLTSVHWNIEGPALPATLHGVCHVITAMAFYKALPCHSATKTCAAITVLRRDTNRLRRRRRAPLQIT